MTTLLEIARAVVDELGLPPITFITGNQNGTARQIVALANRAGDELYQAHQWVQSQIQHIVEVNDTILTTGDTTVSSTIVSNIPSTAGIVANYFAAVGGGLQQSTRVVEVIDPNTLRVDMDATDTQVGAPLTFARDTFTMPEDFSWFLNRTMWDRTNHWELIGPMSPSADQWERSGIVSIGPRRRWRQVGLLPTNWRLWPPPTASNDYPSTMVFEYESEYWALNAGGDRIPRMTADDDTPIVDAQAIILSVKWRLWQAKGFEYGAMQAEYLDYVSRLAARDGGSADLSLSRRADPNWLIGPWNVQDGNFPGQGNP